MTKKIETRVAAGLDPPALKAYTYLTKECHLNFSQWLREKLITEYVWQREMRKSKKGVISNQSERSYNHENRISKSSRSNQE